jgi:hypothetical protein
MNGKRLEEGIGSLDCRNKDPGPIVVNVEREWICDV